MASRKWTSWSRSRRRHRDHAARWGRHNNFQLTASRRWTPAATANAAANKDAIAEVKVIRKAIRRIRPCERRRFRHHEERHQQFRGSFFDIRRDSTGTRILGNARNGIAKAVSSRRTGGTPSGAGRGRAELTSCSSSTRTSTSRHQRRRGAQPFRVRPPRSSAGRLLAIGRQQQRAAKLIRDSTRDCVHGGDTRAAPDGGVLGKIPANRLYPLA